MADPKNCPECGHPMMPGPLQPKRGSGDARIADWYCANCHHVEWAIIAVDIKPVKP